MASLCWQLVYEYERLHWYTKSDFHQMCKNHGENPHHQPVGCTVCSFRFYTSCSWGHQSPSHVNLVNGQWARTSFYIYITMHRWSAQAVDFKESLAVCVHPKNNPYLFIYKKRIPPPPRVATKKEAYMLDFVSLSSEEAPSCWWSVCFKKMTPITINYSFRTYLKSKVGLESVLQAIPIIRSHGWPHNFTIIQVLIWPGLAVTGSSRILCSSWKNSLHKQCRTMNFYSILGS